MQIIGDHDKEESDGSVSTEVGIFLYEQCSRNTQVYKKKDDEWWYVQESEVITTLKDPEKRSCLEREGSSTFTIFRMTFKDPAVISFLKLHYVFQHLQHFLDFRQRCNFFYVWTYIYLLKTEIGTSSYC